MLKLPYAPDQASYSVTDGTTVISTALDGGVSRYRADLLDSSSNVSVQWTLGPADYTYFKTFFRAGINRGADAFLIDLYMDESILTEHVAHIVPGSLKLASQSGLTFVISATLEVEPLNPDDSYDTLLLELVSVYGTVEGLTLALNYLNKIVNIDLAPL